MVVPRASARAFDLLLGSISRRWAGEYGGKKMRLASVDSTIVPSPLRLLPASHSLVADVVGRRTNSMVYTLVDQRHSLFGVRWLVRLWASCFLLAGVDIAQA